MPHYGFMDASTTDGLKFEIGARPHTRFFGLFDEPPPLRGGTVEPAHVRARRPWPAGAVGIQIGWSEHGRAQLLELADGSAIAVWITETREDPGQQQVLRDAALREPAEPDTVSLVEWSDDLVSRIHLSLNRDYFRALLEGLQQALAVQGWDLVRGMTIEPMPDDVVRQLASAFWRARLLYLSPAIGPVDLDCSIENAVQDGAAAMYVRDLLRLLALEGICVRQTGSLGEAPGPRDHEVAMTELGPASAAIDNG